MSGFRPPLVRIPFSLRVAPTVPSNWGHLQKMLVTWSVRGCAHIERHGAPLDVATLPTLSPSDLAGAELVVFHAHVAALFPAPTVILG